MFATRVKLRNWRNFLEVDAPLRECVYLLGANASGKSNFLDAFRFLRDVSKPQGGGLQKAVADRGGVSKIRCLHARKSPEICIEVELGTDAGSTEPEWRYLLAFTQDTRGARQVRVVREEVWHSGECLLKRPDGEDHEDELRLTQTHLEQIQANTKFRDVADFFADITYLHLVPQLLKYGDRIGGQHLEDDPFGQEFLERVARMPEKKRNARLSRIEKVLKKAMPQLQQLQFAKDPATGRPHLELRHVHYRPNAGWQQEEHFSDGTLRLIGLLWSLLEGDSLLLLEEPELSLNNAIVEQIPRMIRQAQRGGKNSRQVFLSTHSEALTKNRGIDGREVLILESAKEGSRVRTIDAAETLALENGFSVAEALLPKTRPNMDRQMDLSL